MKLRAAKPGWSVSADVVVIGSGVAGLTTALQIRAHDLSVLLVTKARVDSGSTKWAQGGIAAALGPGDTPDQHEKDTLVAGAGLCDVAAVKVLVSEGPEAVRKLIARGAVFDLSETGEIALTREGGHLRNRILHAGGDATGAEVSRALLAAVKNDDGIEVLENALVIDALKNETGEVCGVTLHVIGAGTRDGVGQALARAVVIATGGLGQVFSQTTNPSVSTGDGVALALRAGADVADVEFIQFHP
ncbi:MAG: FAD-dependent oxidoreductase, partial [Acidobacteria bacterium]|nr:FAD-dependent oxidoreductase [Acidobacteriota bacterium]